MRVQLLLMLLLFTVALSSCKTYMDVAGDGITTDYMTLRCKNNYNELDYFNKVNGVADKEVFYTTHFTVELPKKIVYWTMSDNRFYYEYDSKQLIYIYTSYKNEGKESDTWELKDIDEASTWKYLEEYWNKRGYDEKEIDGLKSNRVTKLYTNGKYKILLYNIKAKNYASFLERIKSFKVK